MPKLSLKAEKCDSAITTSENRLFCKHMCIAPLLWSDTGMSVDNFLFKNSPKYQEHFKLSLVLKVLDGSLFYDTRINTRSTVISYILLSNTV